MHGARGPASARGPRLTGFQASTYNPVLMATRVGNALLGLGLAASLVQVACRCSDAPVTASAEKVEIADPAQPTPDPSAEARGPLPPGIARLPARATMIAHIDLTRFTSSPLWVESRARMGQDEEAQRMLAAMDACHMPLAGLASLDLGVEPVAQELAAVLTGEGVGVPENLLCLRTQLGDAIGGDWKIEARPPGEAIVVRGAGGSVEFVAHIVDARTVVLASAAWAEPVAEVLRGASSSAARGPLAALLGRAAPTAEAPRAIWFVGHLPPDVLEALATEGADGVEDVRGAIDLDDGLALELIVGVRSADRVPGLLALANARLDLARGLARMQGVPQPIVDSLEVSAEGSEVRLAARMRMADIQAVRKQLEALDRAVDEPIPDDADDADDATPDATAG